MVAQILAVVIFIAMFVLIVLDKIERHYITLGCGLLTLLFVFGVCMHDVNAIVETLNVKQIFTLEFWGLAKEAAAESTSGINWATIIFIAGMMIMVEGMARAGFFRWLCMLIAKMVHYKTIPIFITFMIMSFVLAMFIDSITVILFLAAVTVELAQLLKFNPIPMILSEIFCANLGGSATVCGDPPNIIIGTSLGLSFFDFLKNTGLMAAVCLVVTIIYFYFVYHKELRGNGNAKINEAELPDPKSAITDKKGFIFSCIIFACAVILLVTHAQTGLTVAFIGVFIAILTLITSGKAIGIVLKKVDYKTLLFFIGLFMVVGGLEQTGILEIVAGFIGKISGGNAMIMVAIIIWGSAIASAFVDNIPFAATMVPIIRDLAAATTGVDLHTLAWALSMGTDIGGSATPIGASANVVGTSVAAKEGYPVGWGKYCAKVAPATVLVLIVSTLFIFVRYL
ncbi:MAG: anion permease [Lachnospiraceae bacterium]|nr:anion permease [Lachnospiraceae bacterium]MBP3504833.1 anion permease [Lachnospiraceae bacterium]